MNMPEDTFDRDDGPNSDDLWEVSDPAMRQDRARQLSDDELLLAYKKLHSTKVIDNIWLPILEAEILRRGLQNPS